MANNGYVIPKDMKADILIKGRLSLKDIGIIVVFLVLGFVVSNFVHATGLLKAIIVIVHLLIGFIATAKPKGNPDKSMYLVVLSMFKMDRQGYRSLDHSRYNQKEMK
ncbi:DUF5592 family protein [Macrococcus sp. PK]|uniref:DUF5592 family protein n=1 Tax=Macrococcus sp. PK TaxID=2801919 RepID=UPI001F102325|nr:DUF5592 family protein [Macrococcus sp. PK]MCH4983737.1 hypothetical protein [Macrococcus sp. PK]